MKEAWVEEGWQILNRAEVTCELNKKKASETRRASYAYSAKYKEVEKLFKRHHQLTRMIYKKDPATLVELGITVSFPRKHSEFFDKVKQFYSVVNTNTEMQGKMTAIKVTPEMTTACMLKLDSLLTLRANYDKKKTESQETGVSKDTALTELRKWMIEYNNIMEIAMYDKSQHLNIHRILKNKEEFQESH